MRQGKSAHRFVLYSALGAICAAGTASAQSDASGEASGYVTVLPSYLAADDDRRGTTNDGRGLGVGYGHPITERLSWELQTFGDLLPVQPDTAADFYRYGAGVDLNYRFRRGDGASPFILVGTGLSRNEVVPENVSDTDFFGNVGLGFVTGGLGKSEIRLRGEVRYIRDKFDGIVDAAKNDRRVALGVQIPLGRREVVREVVREVEVERPVPAQIVDSDNDGVPDQNDRCPGTLAGLLTDRNGCAASTSQPSGVRLDGVTFEFNSARLTPSATATLERVAEALRGEPNLRAEIAGHTDSSGSDEYNNRLSQQRAEAVLEFLVGRGIDRSRLQARGYGESRPVASNNTAEGRERNRRVEFNVLN